MIQARSIRPKRGHGFTLVELMVVVGIMMLLVGISVPSIIRRVNAHSIQHAVNQLTDACREARTHAILQGLPVDLKIAPQTGSLAVMALPPSGPSGSEVLSDDGEELFLPQAPTGPAVFRATLSDRIKIDLLGVNFNDYTQEEEVSVRFFPNGTCDAMHLILRSPEENLLRLMTTEVVTSLVEVETDPTKFAATAWK